MRASLGLCTESYRRFVNKKTPSPASTHTCNYTHRCTTIVAGAWKRSLEATRSVQEHSCLFHAVYTANIRHSGFRYCQRKLDSVSSSQSGSPKQTITRGFDESVGLRAARPGGQSAHYRPLSPVAPTTLRTLNRQTSTARRRKLIQRTVTGNICLNLLHTYLSHVPPAR